MEPSQSLRPSTGSVRLHQVSSSVKYSVPNMLVLLFLILLCGKGYGESFFASDALGSSSLEITNGTHRDSRNGMLGVYFNPNDPISRLATVWWNRFFQKPFPTVPQIPVSVAPTKQPTTTTEAATTTTTPASVSIPNILPGWSTLYPSQSPVPGPSPNPFIPVHPGIPTPYPSNPQIVYPPASQSQQSSGYPQQPINHPNYPQQQNPQTGYPQQQGLNPQPGYAQQQGLNPQPGYAQQQGQNPQPGYPQQQGLNPQPGYPQHQGLNPQPDYSQQQPLNPQLGQAPPNQGYPQQLNRYPGFSQQLLNPQFSPPHQYFQQLGYPQLGQPSQQATPQQGSLQQPIRPPNFNLPVGNIPQNQSYYYNNSWSHQTSLPGQFPPPQIGVPGLPNNLLNFGGANSILPPQPQLPNLFPNQPNSLNQQGQAGSPFPQGVQVLGVPNISDQVGQLNQSVEPGAPPQLQPTLLQEEVQELHHEEITVRNQEIDDLSSSNGTLLKSESNFDNSSTLYIPLFVFPLVHEHNSTTHLTSQELAL